MVTSTIPSASPRRALPGRLGAVALAAALAVTLVGCSSSSSDGDDAARRSSTTSSTTSEPTRTTTTAPAPTTAAAGPTTTEPAGGAVPPTGPTDYAGAVDGQGTEVEVTFTRDGAITDFRIEGLDVECLPLGSGEAATRATTVALAEVAVSAAGQVEHTDPDATYRPSLTGSFTEDGTFAGGLYLSGEDDEFVCGGEFTFLARPV